MKVTTGIKNAAKAGTVIAAIFAPFLVVLGALALLPAGIHTLRSADLLDWMWFILLAALVLGIYFLTVYTVDEEVIAEEFQELDRDHDGFITVEDAKNWPELRRAFATFDADHDGRLSRLDFDAFERAAAAR